MSQRRGLRIIDIMIGIVLVAVVGCILKEPRMQASPLNLPTVLRTPVLRADPTRWLAPTAVSIVLVTLFAVTIGSRLVSGRRRVFLEGFALGGWGFFFLAIPLYVDNLFSQAFAPLGRTSPYELTDALTAWLQGLPTGSGFCRIG
jgi:hypothetical protein